MKDGELFFRTDARDEAKALVLEHHYSHRWPRRVVFVITWHVCGGLFGDRGEAVAAAAFGCPNAKWREPVVELQRLVRTPSLSAPLTSLLSVAVKEIHQNLGDELLISYADPKYGHHGGIYQAASWNYSGERCHGTTPLSFLVNGRVMHRRAVSHLYGTASPGKLALHAHDKIIPIPPTAKFLYWRALNRRGKAKAKRLGLESLPYPKPGERKP